MIQGEGQSVAATDDEAMVEGGDKALKIVCDENIIGGINERAEKELPCNFPILQQTNR